MTSGVACVNKDIVLETIHHYKWCQIGGAVNHPEKGKIIDMSEVASQESGVENAYLKIYPTSGYGTPDMLRQVIDIEKPDAILHYTDPRFWFWLYQMEREIRTKIPIFYLNIWDACPDPIWNEDFYRSCDLLMSISKQTYGINRRILSDYKDWQFAYVPHGINPKRFSKLNPNSEELRKFKQQYKLDKYEFLILFSNRNIRRKMPGDVVMAYKHFMDRLSKKDRRKCALVFHTAPVDDNGTDLRAVSEAIVPEYPVIFTYDINEGRIFNDNQMNLLFNSIDILVQISSNEGWGLSTTEGLTAGKPFIGNVTGGIQDQMGFQNKDGEYLTPEDYIELGTNHLKKYDKHGEWVIPVFPKTISLQGSPPTPYIFDERCDWRDVGDAMTEFFKMGKEERERRGELGRQFVTQKGAGMTSPEMGKRFIAAMDTAFKKWKPRDRYELLKIEKKEIKTLVKKITGQQSEQ